VPLPSTAFPEDLVIVVTTPTGQIGRPIIDRFLGVGEEIRVTARAPSRLSPQVRDRVSVVQGSHGDIDVVAEAFADADCEFWLVPPNARADSPERYYLHFTQPASEAIKNQGVRRVVGSQPWATVTAGRPTSCQRRWRWTT
jgi:uncharacterized protein YbjT (DUF2867 family)